jgi:predicted transcriptional regulator
MPRYRIRMINSKFESVDDADHSSLEAARTSAISTAVKVAAEAVAGGEPNAAVEVEIYEDQTVVARKLVTLSVSDLSGGNL